MNSLPTRQPYKTPGEPYGGGVPDGNPYGGGDKGFVSGTRRGSKG